MFPIYVGSIVFKRGGGSNKKTINNINDKLRLGGVVLLLYYGPNSVINTNACKMLCMG